MSYKAPPPDGFENLPILNRATEGYKMWHEFLQHFPRLSRYSLGARIDTLFAEVLELIFLAKYSNKNDKLLFINKATIKLDLLKFFLQIAWTIKALDNGKYARLSKPLNEIGKMLGGWRKLFQKETPR